VFETQETPKNSKVTIIIVIVAVMVVLISATWFLTS
jgi:flagellar basal body-associated protein FliL